MPTELASGSIVHAIQLAIAPVFLLTGIAGLLGVMTTRLARVIDRARSFETTWPNMDGKGRAAARMEISDLERRRRVCNLAISFCTTAALLVCLVIVTLFVEEFLVAKLTWLAGAMFVAAMVAIICGIACFRREVHLATHTISFDPSRFQNE